MKTLDDYFELRNQIFAYFGYVEDWRVIPLDDARKYYWYLEGEGPGNVHFADSEAELESQDGNYYVNEIYTQRFLPKWVYRGAEYTMVAVDTHTDGNHFLQVFSNANERPAGRAAAEGSADENGGAQSAPRSQSDPKLSDSPSGSVDSTKTP